MRAMDTVVPAFLCVHTVALQWIEEVFTVLAVQIVQIIYPVFTTIYTVFRILQTLKVFLADS